ncbi:MAG: S8 family peptidase [Pirellulales bacterium]
MPHQPGFRLPPFTVERVYATSLAETIDWGLKLLGVPDQWKRTKGAGVRVAVLDTGADMFHAERGDLAAAIVATADFTNSRFGWHDRNGHGTHCAGVIGARHDDRGVVGIAPECTLVIGKVLGDDGAGSSIGIAQGIDWAVTFRPQVISMSLGSPQPDARIHAAIRRAVAAGVYVICAAGNDGPGPRDTVGWPARYDEPVAVGAVDQLGAVASFSSRGPAVDICAPGVDVLSTYLMGQYAKLSGTSMATPHVAGIVALMVAHRLATGEALPAPTELTQLLKETATGWQPGQGAGSGAGIINPTKVIGINRPAPIADQPPTLKLGFVNIYVPSRAGDLFSIGV